MFQPLFSFGPWICMATATQVHPERSETFLTLFFTCQDIENKGTKSLVFSQSFRITSMQYYVSIPSKMVGAWGLRRLPADSHIIRHTTVDVSTILILFKLGDPTVLKPLLKCDCNHVPDATLCNRMRHLLSDGRYAWQNFKSTLLQDGNCVVLRYWFISRCRHITPAVTICIRPNCIGALDWAA